MFRKKIYIYSLLLPNTDNRTESVGGNHLLLERYVAQNQNIHSETLHTFTHTTTTQSKNECEYYVKSNAIIFWKGAP